MVGKCAEYAAGAAWLVAIRLLAGSAALGQDQAVLEELRRWHDRLTKPGETVSLADGRAAADKLKAWNLPINDLEPEQRGQVIRLTIYAALAVGDAGRAADWLGELERTFPDARDTLRAAWLVAGATGDAELARRTLRKLKEQGAASETAVTKRLHRLRMIGHPAPDIQVTVEGSAGVSPAGARRIGLRQRDGVVLVLDFWRVSQKPTDKQVQSLRELYQAYVSEPKVQFFGVNADPPADVEAARKFAADNGYAWPQHYERPSGGAPLTDEAFQVDSVPWQVIVDADGNVRAVGSAGDPEFQYALRAAVAEVRGEYRALRPKTTEGVSATVKTPEPPAVQPQPKEPEKPVGKGDLPRNPEAQRLLDQARVYLKTGRKTDARKLLKEIIEKYPGTWEAAEAKERLDALGG
jgi:hypothetical protein